MTLRITLAAHLCGVGMGVATIVGLVPSVVRMMRALLS
jgi:hypothetical protein